MQALWLYKRQSRAEAKGEAKKTGENRTKKSVNSQRRKGEKGKKEQNRGDEKKKKRRRQREREQ